MCDNNISESLRLQVIPKFNALDSITRSKAVSLIGGFIAGVTTVIPATDVSGGFNGYSRLYVNERSTNILALMKGYMIVNEYYYHSGFDTITNLRYNLAHLPRDWQPYVQSMMEIANISLPFNAVTDNAILTRIDAWLFPTLLSCATSILEHADAPIDRVVDYIAANVDRGIGDTNRMSIANEISMWLGMAFGYTYALPSSETSFDLYFINNCLPVISTLVSKINERVTMNVDLVIETARKVFCTRSTIVYTPGVLTTRIISRIGHILPEEHYRSVMDHVFEVMDTIEDIVDGITANQQEPKVRGVLHNNPDQPVTLGQKILDLSVVSNVNVTELTEGDLTATMEGIGNISTVTVESLSKEYNVSVENIFSKILGKLKDGVGVKKTATLSERATDIEHRMKNPKVRQGKFKLTGFKANNIRTSSDYIQAAKNSVGIYNSLLDPTAGGRYYQKVMDTYNHFTYRLKLDIDSLDYGSKEMDLLRKSVPNPAEYFKVLKSGESPVMVSGDKVVVDRGFVHLENVGSKGTIELDNLDLNQAKVVWGICQQLKDSIAKHDPKLYAGESEFLSNHCLIPFAHTADLESELLYNLIAWLESSLSESDVNVTMEGFGSYISKVISRIFPKKNPDMESKSLYDRFKLVEASLEKGKSRGGVYKIPKNLEVRCKNTTATQLVDSVRKSSIIFDDILDRDNVHAYLDELNAVTKKLESESGESISDWDARSPMYPKLWNSLPSPSKYFNSLRSGTPVTLFDGATISVNMHNGVSLRQGTSYLDNVKNLDISQAKQLFEVFRHVWGKVSERDIDVDSVNSQYVYNGYVSEIQSIADSEMRMMFFIIQWIESSIVIE